MTMEVFIIGLGEIGASICLAMNESGVDVSCTGYDPNAQIAREARKRGDIDRIVFTPRKASQMADIIFMTIAPDLVKEHLQAIGPTLKTGAVIFEMGSLKSATMGWASETIRQGCYFVGAIPVVNSDHLQESDAEGGLPHADMFTNGSLALAIPPNTPENVIDLTYAIAGVLGAEPFFIDPGEIDGITATIEQLPALISLIQLQLGLQSPIWREIRRLAGRAWLKSTVIGASYDATELTESVKLNRQNVIFRLDSLREEIERLRQVLSEEDDDAFSEYVKDSINAFHSWTSDRRTGSVSAPDLDVPEVPRLNLLDRFFGTGKSRPKKR